MEDAKKIKQCVNNIVFALSGKAGAGKDTTAYMIKRYIEDNYKSKVFVLAYADYLKVLASRNLGYSDDNKQEQRRLLQNLGTKIRFIDNNFFVDIVYHTIDTLKDEYDVFIITDVRYENELKPKYYRLSYPIFNIFIDRDKQNIDSKHISKQDSLHDSEELATNVDYDKFHFVIDNNYTLQELYTSVSSVVDTVFSLADNVLQEQRAIEEENVDIDDDTLIEEFNKMLLEIQEELVQEEVEEK